jgi:hypothetical protein
MLNAPIDWLLEESNPSVRYLTLRDILLNGNKDRQLEVCREAIQESPVVKKIISKMDEKGYWGDSENPYLPKYKSSYWQIVVLGLLHAENSNEKIRKACEHIFGFQQKSGAFSAETKNMHVKRYQNLLSKGKRLPPFQEWSMTLVHEQELSCLTGNMVSSLMRLGYGDDSRVKRAIDWLVKIQNEDGGWKCPYWRAHVKDMHACFHGTACALEAFGELPKGMRTRSIDNAVDGGVEFLLMHHLYKADHHGYSTINKEWMVMRFPWFAGYNILRGLDVVTKLGAIDDKRLADGVDVVMSKRIDGSRWVLEKSHAGQMLTNLERKGEPSKWITMISLRILRRIFGA